MNIEVGKSYRDRFGSEWKALFDDDDDEWPIGCIRSDGKVLTFCRDGSYFSAEEKSDFDLIEEWLESF